MYEILINWQNNAEKMKINAFLVVLCSSLQNYAINCKTQFYCDIFRIFLPKSALILFSSAKSYPIMLY
jgi:hypothetical protein